MHTSKSVSFQTPSSSTVWTDAMVDRSFRRHLLVTIILLLATLIGLSRFLEFVEARPGTVLTDPILQWFSPVDLTWLTFALIYLGLVAGLATLLRSPRVLVIALQSYILMVAVRMVMMYAFPLDPPAGLIPLKDPFVQYFGSGQPPTKDLFFSGHTSTLFLLFLTAQTRKMKALFLACTVAVGIAVILQHVHYTADVLVAPFVSFGVYRIVQHLHRRSALRIIRRDRIAARRSGTASLVFLLLLPAASSAHPLLRSVSLSVIRPEDAALSGSPDSCLAYASHFSLTPSHHDGSR